MFQVVDNYGQGVDAHYDLDPGAIIFRSRGGSKSGENPINTEYAKGLRILLDRIIASDLKIEGAWVDSSRVQNLPLTTRQILFDNDFPIDAGSIFTKMTNRMAQVGRSPTAKPGGGNATKRIKISR